jgi:hypothetical protein
VRFSIPLTCKFPADDKGLTVSFGETIYCRVRVAVSRITLLVNGSEKSCPHLESQKDALKNQNLFGYLETSADLMH